nr:type 4 pilus major pilin [uncultured Desulfuromusa sp.]
MGLTLDESKKEEEAYTINEIEILIDKNVLPHTKGNQIDYISNSYGQGFSIAPAAGSSCGSCSGC